jgi:hypothetical protein
MSYGAPPQLTPASLFEEQAKLDAIRLETYNRILAQVHQKIKFISTQPNSSQMAYYDFPEWQPGCPRYDVKDCILYIAWTLRNSGFQVLYISPNRLLISWKEQSIRYYQEESPIRQAMLAAANPGVASALAQGKPDKKKPDAYRPAPQGVAAMLAQTTVAAPRRPKKKDPHATITFI